MEVGFGRAGDGALGFAAMTGRAPAGAAFACVALAACLAGCSAIGGIAGAVAGVATGTFSSNPAVGIGVGIAVQAATDTAIQNIFRNMQRSEQDRIASLAGDMAIGDVQPWDIHHRIPFNDERGQLQVVGVIDNAIASCKEVMFSVVEGKKDAPVQHWFITQTCRQSDGQWRWAAAEPAVARWGSLQ